MAEEKEAPKRVSRRQFVKGAAVGGAGVAAAGVLASCAPAAPPAATPAPAATCPPAEECAPCPTPWLPETWDKEADVVIVGYGGAGAAAAIVAHDAGAKVLILEKQPDDTATEVRHTCSSRTSGGNAWFWEGSEADAISYLRWATAGMVPDDVIEAYVAKWVLLDKWMESLGGTPVFVEYEWEVAADAPGYNGGKNWSLSRWVEAPLESGAAGWRLYEENVREIRGIEVLFETPGKRLITDPVTGEVLGVEGTMAGQPVYVKASKAVVLACGGFQYNEELKKEAFGGVRFEYYANPGNTGDGIVMAVGAGAELWHMPLGAGRIGMARFPGTPAGQRILIAHKAGGSMVVDQYGKRFANEKEVGDGHSGWIEASHVVPHNAEHPRNPCWLIFDETVRLSGPYKVLQTTKKGELPDGTMQYWLDPSEDLSVEIAEGWILKGDTIEELAASIKADLENQSGLHPEGRMDPATLEETLMKYNEYCAAGEDLEFHKPQANLIALTPPYYAAKVYPGGPNTWGGPRKNGKMQVLRPDGTVIGRLYCVGELGSINTLCYPLTNYTEISLTGQIAGENAAAETAWA